MLSIPVFAQSDTEVEGLGLPGDNLDLYAVLDLFQKSKTIEDFEKELNLEKTGINNLDLDLDGKVDFIKVVTTQEGDDFTFVLQVAVSEKETQDVAVILVSKDENKEVTMQIVGDKDLYGKDYIIEPEATTPGVTANPAYKGDDPVTENVPATTTTVVVQSAPIVQYVYSPVYVPYYPPYHYGYYPPYFNPFAVMAVGIYWGHHAYYHHGGYGYHHTTVIVNHNHYNNYNVHRNYSNTVAHNRANGNYGNTRPSTRPSTGNSSATKPSTGASTRPSAGTSNKPSTGAATRPSTTPSTRPSTGSSASSRPSTSPSTRPSTSPSTRPSTSPSTRPSTPSSMGASRSMHSGGYSGASRGGGGASRGGGGRRM